MLQHQYSWTCTTRTPSTHRLPVCELCVGSSTASCQLLRPSHMGLPGFSWHSGPTFSHCEDTSRFGVEPSYETSPTW